MALVLSLNPSLEKWYWINDFDIGKSFIVKDFKYTIGGGGINVAKVINGFNEPVAVMGFAGGNSGMYIERELDRMSIVNKFIPIEEDSANTVRIIRENNIYTEIVEEGPSVSSYYVSQLYELYKELILKEDLICVCGDLPRGLPTDILSDLIILATKYNKKFFLSAKGEYLKAGIKTIPYFACLTKEELECYLGFSVETNLEVIQAGKYLSNDGIEVLMLFLGKDDVYVFHDGYIYMIRIPNIEVMNPIGVRDSMVGGYIVSLMREYDFEFTLKMSVACGLSNGLVAEPGKVDMVSMKRIMNDLVIIRSQF